MLLAVTLPAGEGANSSYSLAAMVAFESALLVVGAVLVLSPKLGSHEHHGVMLGTAAGILFGVSDVAIKALTGSVGSDGAGARAARPGPRPAPGLGHRLYRVRGAGSRRARPCRSITPTSAAGANVTAISGGILVFGDPLPKNTLGIVLQSFAFVLVIVAAALTPAPSAPARRAGHYLASARPGRWACAPASVIVRARTLTRPITDSRRRPRSIRPRPALR